MKHLLFILFLSNTLRLGGQPWVDPVYEIQTISDLSYGTATSFAGKEDTLTLDISFPEDDIPPPCGRPLLVMVHGGAWFAGDKNEGYAKSFREDFARRGYVTASVNYRLGLFQTDQFVNCNIPDWNCFNMTDSSEWYRANYRAIQDVNGAIRWLINRATDYQIDPDNVFLVGESAGGFIAIGAGFLDDPGEILTDLSGLFPNAPEPNELYESACIQTYQIANDIAEMDLSRPALGTYQGTLNVLSGGTFRIRAVGSFFGGAFNNLFRSFSDASPALYLYHQPCDLIVPFQYDRLLAGYNSCAMGFPSNCGNIINRPLVYGSAGIRSLIDTLQNQGFATAEYFFDNSGNNYSCLQQVLDPALSCHAIDNYSLRSGHMASFFASRIDNCVTNVQSDPEPDTNLKISIYPNPVSEKLNIDLSESGLLTSILLYNQLGMPVFNQTAASTHSCHISMDQYPAGIYFLVIRVENRVHRYRIIVP